MGFGGVSDAERLEWESSKYSSLVLSAKNLHDAIGNTTPLASQVHPKVYEAILNLRRELMK